MKRFPIISPRRHRRSRPAGAQNFVVGFSSTAPVVGALELEAASWEYSEYGWKFDELDELTNSINETVEREPLLDDQPEKTALKSFLEELNRERSLGTLLVQHGEGEP